jgi:hypothetical protein
VTALSADSRAAEGHAATVSSGVDQAIRVSTAVAVLAVAGVAAYVSYWHAYAVVRAHGGTGITAQLEPATIDGLVYASSMVILYAARHRLRVPPLARWLLALGILATLTANVAQGWSNGPVGAVVAAWPAVSLVGSYELLVWIIRTAADGGVVRVPRVDWAGGPDRDGLFPAGQPADHSPVEDGLAAGSEPDDQSVASAAVAAYRASVADGKPLSERKLAEMFGKTSRRWARSRIDEARRPT